MKNTLILLNQSSFKTGGLCTNQLLFVAHEIYRSFYDGYDVRGVVLDISKAFDKVWHSGLPYNLGQNGITSNLLNILMDILKDRKQ